MMNYLIITTLFNSKKYDKLKKPKDNDSKKPKDNDDSKIEEKKLKVSTVKEEQNNNSFFIELLNIFWPLLLIGAFFLLFWVINADISL